MNATPSSTALLIARATLLAERLPELRPLLPTGSVGWVRRWLPQAGGWFEWCLRRPWACRRLLAVQQAMVPGLFLHFLARKQKLERWAGEALLAGCRQGVVLGAGLDTLAWRLKQPATAWFELDRPETLAFKKQSRSEGDEPHLLPLDLERGEADTALLQSVSFSAALPAFYVAEGLLMYLPGARVEQLMARLAALSASGSRFAMTFMERREGVRLAFRGGHWLIDFWLQWRREPFRWGVNAGNIREELEALGRRTGWRLVEVATPADLRRDIVTPAGLAEQPLAEGESLALFTKIE